MIASALTDLPEPLSPTTPRISPRPMSNRTPSSTVSRARKVLNETVRSSTASRVTGRESADRECRAGRRPEG